MSSMACKCRNQDRFWIDGNEDWRCSKCGEVIEKKGESNEK
jgi:PHP family Zn ribbon phosphoesterase